MSCQTINAIDWSLGLVIFYFSRKIIRERSFAFVEKVRTAFRTGSKKTVKVIRLEAKSTEVKSVSQRIDQATWAKLAFAMLTLASAYLIWASISLASKLTRTSPLFTTLPTSIFNSEILPEIFEAISTFSLVSTFPAIIKTGRLDSWPETAWSLETERYSRCILTISGYLTIEVRYFLHLFTFHPIFIRLRLISIRTNSKIVLSSVKIFLVGSQKLLNL